MYAARTYLMDLRKRIAYDASRVSEMSTNYEHDMLLLRHVALQEQYARERDVAAQKLAAVIAERDNLRASYDRLREQLELLRRRIFGAKAERVDVAQLELEFADTQKQLDALHVEPASDAGTYDDSDGGHDGDDDGEPIAAKRKPNGRRDLTRTPVVREDRKSTRLNSSH